MKVPFFNKRMAYRVISQTICVYFDKTEGKFTSLKNLIILNPIRLSPNVESIHLPGNFRIDPPKKPTLRDTCINHNPQIKTIYSQTRTRARNSTYIKSFQTVHKIRQIVRHRKGRKYRRRGRAGEKRTRNEKILRYSYRVQYSTAIKTSFPKIRNTKRATIYTRSSRSYIYT